MDLWMDVGSTFIKYWIADADSGEEIAAKKLPFPEPDVDDGVRFEVSADRIWEIVSWIFLQAEKQHCTRALISVQMHGYLLRDKAGVFSAYISWRDRRGDTCDPALQGIAFDRCGTSCKNNLPAVSLCSYGKSFDDTEFFTLGSYLAYRLTGRNASHKTDACASGFFDADTLEREVNLFPGLKLPEVFGSAAEIGVYHGMRVYTPFGDHQISFLGSGSGKDQYYLNIGTAAQLSFTAKECDFSGCEKRPYFTAERLMTISGLTGGDAIFHRGGGAKLSGELRTIFSQLPRRREILLGGGGGHLVYEAVSEVAREYGMSCRLIEKAAGYEGLKKMAEKTRRRVGTMLSEVNFPNFPLILKNNGLDFFIIDNEHGAFDYAFLSSLLMVAGLVGMPAIIRLPDNSRGNITKLADMGAGGFLLPMTNTAEDIRQVVAYARYAPEGKRGISTNRAHTRYCPPALQEYLPAANCRMKIYAQIETLEGCRHAEDILAVDGVDGVFIGPNDLSADLQCIGDYSPLFPYIERICSAADAVGKDCGIITADKELLHFAGECGARLFSCGSEINMLKDAARNIRERLDGILTERPAKEQKGCMG